MRFIVYNLKGERIQDLFGIAEHKLIAGGLDTMTIRTVQNFVQKNYRILYMDPKTGKWYEFIAASPEDNHGPEGITYTIYAENSLIGITGWIEDRRAYGDEETPGVSADFALSIALAGTGWSGEAENFDPQKINFYHVTPYEAIKKIVETFKAEIETEIVVEGRSITRRLHLRHKVGKFWGKRFSFAKDMTNIKRTISPDDIITRLYGYGKGEEKEGGGYGRRISFESINDGKPYLDNEEATQKYCYKGIPFVGSAIFEDIEDPAALKKATQKELDALSRPKVTYETSVTDLASYGMDFEDVQVGDTCNGRDKDLDIAFTARITEMTVDPDGIKPTQIVLGEYLDILSRSNSEMEKDIASLKARSTLWDNIAHGNFTTKFIDSVIGGVNEQFVVNGSYIRMDPKRGIFITDKATEEESTWAMQLSSAGFRIADGKTGENWNWRTFGTGKGFIADLIVAGMLKGGNVTWNLETGGLNIANKFWYHPSNGLLELSDGIISGKNGSWDLGSGYFETWYNGSLVRIYNGELSVYKNNRLMNVMNGNGYFVYNQGNLSGKIISDGFIGSSSNFNIFHSTGNSLTIGYNGEASGNGFNTYVIFDKSNNSGWMYGGAAITFYEPTRFNTKVIINGELDGNVITQINKMITDKTDKLDNQIFQVEQDVTKKIDSHTWSLQSHQQQINNLSSAVSDLKRRVANLGG